jgi:hypothetical protein
MELAAKPFSIRQKSRKVFILTDKAVISRIESNDTITAKLFEQRPAVGTGKG